MDSVVLIPLWYSIGTRMIPLWYLFGTPLVLLSTTWSIFGIILSEGDGNLKVGGKVRRRVASTNPVSKAALRGQETSKNGKPRLMMGEPPRPELGRYGVKWSRRRPFGHNADPGEVLEGGLEY